MLTAGVIKQININSGNFKANKYIVEITLFKRPGAIDKNAYTFETNCAILPGASSAYEVGDTVYIDFMNDSLNSPVIIGKIYQGPTVETRGALGLKKLAVESSVELPSDTTIGDLLYADIENAVKFAKNDFKQQLFEVDADGYYIIDAGRIAETGE